VAQPNNRDRIQVVCLALTMAACAARVAPPAAPSPPGPPRDCGAALYCDDFERQPAGEPPRAPWATRLREGSVQVDGTRAFSGRQSVRVRTFASSERQRRAMFGIEGGPVFNPTQAVLAGRMMVWLDTPPSSNAHFSLVEGEGVIPERNVRAKTRYGGQFKKLMANYDTDRRAGVFTDCAKRAPEVELPPRRWVCLEWRFDAQADEMRLWLDGAPIDILTVPGRGDVCLGHALEDAWDLPVYDAVRVGFQHFQTMDPIDMWIDDVAFGRDRLGCPTAPAR
jgi:hypothetical protein